MGVVPGGAGVVELTAEQKDVVNVRPEGDLLVKGIPGSGKTLTIVARAAKLSAQQLLSPEADVPLVRIFTFNRMLMEWIGYLSSQLQEEPLEVTTFHSWASQALKAMGVHEELEYQDFAAALLERMRALGGLPPHFRAHHVLVDEGQDLYAAELQLVKLSAITTFTIAADKAQNIYRTGFTFKSVGIKVQGRTKSLTANMRGTLQIAALASDLARHDPSLEREDFASDLDTLRDGPIPEIYFCDGFDAEDRIVRETIRLARGENRNATIAILHPNKKAVFRIKNAIGGRILDRKNPDMTSPGIIVSTIHNAKGLEFDTVIVKGCNEGTVPWPPAPDQTAAESLELGRRLLYVAITRARRRLVLICGHKPSPLIKELEKDHYREAR